VQLDAVEAWTKLHLIAPAEGLQKRRMLGILHKLALLGCSSELCGRVLHARILLPPDSHSGIVHGPHLCPCITEGADVSVLLLGLERCSGLFRNLCRGILYN
jgi:hypothetical protein